MWQKNFCYTFLHLKQNHLSLIGAYSDSAGLPVVREDIARYISERDGVPADPANVFLSTGASEAIRVRSVFNSLCKDITYWI